MEFMDFWKHTLNHHFSYSCRGMFYLSGCWVHLLLGLPILGWWKAGTFCVLPRRCLDFGSLDCIPGRRLLWCSKLSNLRGCTLQSGHKLSTRHVRCQSTSRGMGFLVVIPGYCNVYELPASSVVRMGFPRWSHGHHY
jgi:hypothetical protein